MTRHRPGSQAKKPRTAGVLQPACTYKEHQILSTAEATSFASQFWDRKVQPTKASQQEFLVTCIDIDLEKNVKHAQWHKDTRKRGHQTTYFVPHRGAAVPCALLRPMYRQVSSRFLKNMVTYPPPYISETAFSQRFQKLYTYPPPRGTIFWRIRRKVQKLRGKSQNPPSWDTMNVPER